MAKRLKRVLLIDDEESAIAVLSAAFSLEEEYHVEATARDGDEGLRLLNDLKPDLAFIDMKLPGLIGVDVIRKARKQSPSTILVAISGHVERPFVKHSLQAGAMGYILKGSRIQGIRQALRSIEANKVYLSPEVSDVVLDEFINNTSQSEEPDAYECLSPRERDVLALYGQGKLLYEVAFLLSLSAGTIKTHLSRIRTKLEMSDPEELRAYACHQNLFVLPKK